MPRSNIGTRTVSHTIADCTVVHNHTAVGRRRVVSDLCCKVATVLSAFKTAARTRSKVRLSLIYFAITDYCISHVHIPKQQYFSHCSDVPTGLIVAHAHHCRCVGGGVAVCTVCVAKLKIILQMSLVLVWGARIPTVRIGRVAGQYGKPRSAPTEMVNGRELPCYKGDNVNSYECTEEARAHDPNRLVEGHFHSACTLNYIRSLIKGGYAVLYSVHHMFTCGLSLIFAICVAGDGDCGGGVWDVWCAYGVGPAPCEGVGSGLCAGLRAQGSVPGDQ